MPSISSFFLGGSCVRLCDRVQHYWRRGGRSPLEYPLRFKGVKGDTKHDVTGVEASNANLLAVPESAAEFPT